MSSNASRIFVVDDDPVARMILADELAADNYDLHEFDNGQACLDALDQNPDLILMDVEMPGLSGYEVCNKIKQDASTQHIDVIFISSHDTTDERLEGFNAGASDYIIKPVQPKELHNKVERILSDIIKRAEAAVEKQGAIEMAMTAMTNASEQGVVLNFMRQSFSIKDLKGLADLIIESFNSFSVNTCIQIRTPSESLTVSNTPPATPLEEELLTRLVNSGRIKESGRRLIANFGDISLLIKNMPDDTDKAGRLRDHLALLLEGAEARLKAIITEMGLASLVEHSQVALENIETMQNEHKLASVKIMDNVMQQLEESFMSYGLTEEQEMLLLKVVQDGVDESLTNLEKGQEVDAAMRDIINRLKEF